jgi:hypothetical protein
MKLLLALALSFAPAPPVPSWRVDLDPHWRDRFPDATFTRDALARSRHRLRWLDQRIRFYGPYAGGADTWAYWRQDQAGRVAAWDALWWQERDRLRHVLGEDRWRRGCMPAPAPLCRWGLEE